MPRLASPSVASAACTDVVLYRRGLTHPQIFGDSELIDVKDRERKAQSELEAARAALEQHNVDLSDALHDLEAAQEAKAESEQALAEAEAKIEAVVQEKDAEISEGVSELDQANEMISQKQHLIEDLQESVCRYQTKERGAGVVKTLRHLQHVHGDDDEDAVPNMLPPLQMSGSSESLSATPRKVKRRGSFFSRANSKPAMEVGGGGGGVKSVTSALKGMFGMADSEDEELVATAMEAMPALLTVCDTDGFRAKQWVESATRLVAPLGNSVLLSECQTMDGYLSTMLHNMNCLAQDYDRYCQAASEIENAADKLNGTIFAFAGVSAPAKLYFRLLHLQHKGVREQLEVSQRLLENALEGFWRSDDALAWKDGSLFKMMNEAVCPRTIAIAAHFYPAMPGLWCRSPAPSACPVADVSRICPCVAHCALQVTSLNISYAKALQHNDPKKYESSLNSVRKAGAELAVKLWDYATTIETLALSRTLDMNTIFAGFLTGQMAILEGQHTQQVQLADAVSAMQTELTQKKARQQELASVQETFRARLSL
eukprot:SAG11_NODE_30_length_23132_cov_22.413277_11_plen_543_part_00